MHNAIITGGAGFIGSHLADSIKDKYDIIYIVDNLIRTSSTRNISHLSNDEKFVFIECEITDFLKNHIHLVQDVKVVYHLAATRINRCAQNPLEGHKFLAEAGFEIVKYCAENNIKLFFASTASVYNNPKKFPIEESDPCSPHTIYGSAKYYTENLIRSFAKSHNLEYAICRFFSVYGVRMDCEGAYTEIIFNWLKQISNGNNEVTVFGNPDEKILDLVYVEDVVNAILKTTENFNNDVYNVSTETGVSITDLIKTIENSLDIKLKINILPENRNDIENKRIGSTNKLKSIGWNPKNTLESGIIKTYQWIQKL
jgi:UDP-glucose 4-epimerase